MKVGTKDIGKKKNQNTLHSDASVITHLKFKPDSKNCFVVYSISIFTDCVFPCTRF